MCRETSAIGVPTVALLQRGGPAEKACLGAKYSEIAARPSMRFITKLLSARRAALLTDGRFMIQRGERAVSHPKWRRFRQCSNVILAAICRANLRILAIFHGLILELIKIDASA